MTLYARPPSERVIVPFELFHDPMERLLIVNFRGDPEYDGIELQVFDDEVKGHGLAALMYRTDGKLDWYMTPGLALDREAASVGAGLGEWVTQDFPYRLDIGTHGVDAEVHFSLHDGRQVELAVTEHRRTPGRHIDLLAPLGVGIERPTFLPYFVMFGIDLVRRGGTDVTMRIAGADRELERIPVPIPYSGRLCYLARYCDEPFIMRINPAISGPARTVDPAAGGGGGERLAFIEREGHAELARLSVSAAGHEAWLELDPALPDLAALADGATSNGRFAIGSDDLQMIAGDITIVRAGQEATLTMQPTEPWRPAGGALVWLTLRMFPSFFRTWTTTYRWEATLSLAETAKIRSSWSRTGDRG
jgi:hypothetical protein